MSAAVNRAACASQRIQLVDENDGRGLGARLLEEIANPCCADTDKHLHELRARDREERHLRFARDRLGQQGLAGAGWADEEHAFGHAAAQPTIALGVLQEIDDLAQLVLRLVYPRNIGESYARIRFDI